MRCKRCGADHPDATSWPTYVWHVFIAGGGCPDCLGEETWYAIEKEAVRRAGTWTLHFFVGWGICCVFLWIDEATGSDGFAPVGVVAMLSYWYAMWLIGAHRKDALTKLLERLKGPVGHVDSDSSDTHFKC